MEEAFNLNITYFFKENMRNRTCKDVILSTPSVLTFSQLPFFFLSSWGHKENENLNTKRKMA